MTKLLFLVFAFSAVLLSACNVVRGSGNVVTESRTVSNFDRVSLSGQGELILTQGEEESLTIEAEDNIIAVIETNVRGGTLEIGTRDNTLVTNTEPIRYYLTMTDISGLEISGSGSISAESVTAENLALDISGSGEITIDTLTADSVNVDISGSGNVQLGGEVTRQVVDISGSGSYQGGDVASATTTVDVSGSGTATVWVTESLSTNISGSGSVNYYGTPSVSQDVSGSGSLSSLGEK